MSGILTGTKGKTREVMLRQHSITEFEKAMDKFLRGEVPASVVTERGRKLTKRLRKSGRL